ncbi:hypothetical protein [Actinoallomurus acanthiterrae]
MEALTAVTVLVGKYGVQRLVGSLTGRQGLGDLASELFGTLAASEDRLAERLAGIEQQLSGIERRLDEVLDQRYQVSLVLGLRGLLEAGAAHDPLVRTEELTNARERFREAAASARSSLQTAVAERYVVLCAIALGRPDAAKTAWAQLNGAVTATALDLCTAFGEAHGKVALRLEQEGVSKNRRFWKRVDDEATQARDGVMEAVGLVESLLVESGVLGQVLGQPQPPRIDKKETQLDYRQSNRQLRELTFYKDAPILLGPMMGASSLGWDVQPIVPGPVRFGALVVTWTHLEPRPNGWDPGNVGRAPTVDADVGLTVLADPPLSRDVSIDHPRRFLASPEHGPLSLKAGDRSTQLSYVTALTTDERGNATKGDSVRVGDITFHSYFGPLG